MQQARNFFVNLKFKKGNNQFSFFTLNLKKKRVIPLIWLYGSEINQSSTICSDIYN